MYFLFFFPSAETIFFLDLPHALLLQHVRRRSLERRFSKRNRSFFNEFFTSIERYLYVLFFERISTRCSPFFSSCKLFTSINRRQIFVLVDYSEVLSCNWFCNPSEFFHQYSNISNNSSHSEDLCSQTYPANDCLLSTLKNSHYPGITVK